MEENIEKNMEDITELDLMKEFIRLADKPLLPNEITVNLLTEISGKRKRRARYILAKYEQEGFLNSRKIVIDGRCVNAYSPANGTWEDVIKELENKE